MNKRKTIEIAVLLVLACALSFGFVLLYSTATSPLYPDYFGTDSAQYVVIASNWIEGRIPYVGLFDHKGPFIFWINLIGILTSTWVVQSVFLLFSLLGFYAIVAEYVHNVFLRWIGLFFSFGFVAICYCGGNMTEEYCLPFLTWSLWLMIRYIRGNSEEHSPVWALFYGVCTAICFLTRFTNVALVASGVLIITVYLIYKKQIRNLVYNAIAFILGFGLLFIPFAIYFLYHNCFTEFINGTILFNIKYLGNMVPWFLSPSLTGENIKNFFIYFSPLLLSILIPILTRKNKLLLGWSLVTLGLEMYVFMSGAIYYHYVITAIPQMAVLFGEVLTNRKNDKPIRLTIGIVTVLYMIVIARFAGLSVLRQPMKEMELYSEYKAKGYERLAQLIPQNSPMVTYGDASMQDFYIRCPYLYPCYNYYVLQDWQGSFSEEMADNIHSTFENGGAEYILAEDSNSQGISDILERDYSIVDTNGDYTLYRLSKEARKN